MRFCEFAQIMFKHSGYVNHSGLYVIELFDAITEDDCDNPFQNLGIDALERFFRGSRTLSKRKVQLVYAHKNEHAFASYVNSLSATNQERLEKELRELLPTLDFNDNLGYACADLFLEILDDILENQEHSYQEELTLTKTVASVKVPQNTVYYDSVDEKLHIDKITLDLPKDLLPPEMITEEENPYVQELLLAFASKLGKNQIELSNLPESDLNKFKRQRINFYSASRIERFVRESIDDGKKEVETWKDETFDYIEETLEDDYQNGYRRLNKVMQKVVDCQTTSVIDQFQNLIGPKEKKGVCHLLVNDGKVKWVNTDD